MQIRVVSMESSSDRRSVTESHLREIGLDFIFFDAVDGISEQSISSYFTCKPDFLPRAYSRRKTAVTTRELACTLSHMRVIRQAWLEHPQEPLLVLEDDVLFCTKDLTLTEYIFAKIPDDAAYAQFALTPAKIITLLGQQFKKDGSLFIAKSGPASIALNDHVYGCHCAAAYLVTPLGMRSVASQWFDEGDRAIFPCAANELTHNVALVADRLVYQAASSQGAIGYACSAPLATTVAFESTIKSSRDSTHKPARLAGHQEARDMALTWFDALKPSLSR